METYVEPKETVTGHPEPMLYLFLTALWVIGWLSLDDVLGESLWWLRFALSP